MGIVFLGEDSFSAAVLNSLIECGYKILSVFTPVYNNVIYKRLENICNNYSIPFRRVDNINSIIIEDEIKKLSPDLICVCHFEKILKKNIIQIPRFGCINLHPSLLPRYRGLSPQHWPIINGDEYTGITVHYIDEGIDTGEIIIQKIIPIDKDDYVADLQKKMLVVYKTIYVEALKLILQSNKKDSRIVIPNEGSYYGRLKPENCIIVLADGVKVAYNKVRALSLPYHGATFQGYKIWRARVVSFDSASTEELGMIKLKEGIYLDSIFGPIIKFHDGFLVLEKYLKNDRKNY